MNAAFKLNQPVSTQHMRTFVMGFVISVLLLVAAELLRIIFVRTLGIQYDVALQYAMASMVFDALALLSFSACFLFLLSSFTSIFRGQLTTTLFALVAIFLFVSAMRIVGVVFWDQFDFALPRISIVALGPVVPSILGVVAAGTLAKEFVIQNQDLRVRFNSVALIFGIGTCVIFSLALLRPFASMLSVL